MSLGFDTLTSNFFFLYITCSPHTHPDLVQDLTIHKHSIQKTYFLKTSYPGMQDASTDQSFYHKPKDRKIKT